MREEADDALDLETHQVVKDMRRAMLLDRTVHHFDRLRDGLIASIEIGE